MSELPVLIYVFIMITLGFVSIFVEFLLIPGFTIFGLIGFFLILGGIFTAATKLSLVPALILAVSSLAALRFMLAAIPNSKMAKRFVLNARLEPSGKQANTVEIGEIGKTLTPLRPAGAVLVNGKRYDALSEGDFIPAGREVEVVSKYQQHIMVKLKS